MCLSPEKGTGRICLYVSIFVMYYISPWHSYYFILFSFYFIYLKQVYTMQPWLAWSSPCRSGRPWTQRDLPASTLPLWALGLKVCVTMPGKIYLFLCVWIFLLHVSMLVYHVDAVPLRPEMGTKPSGIQSVAGC